MHPKIFRFVVFAALAVSSCAASSMQPGDLSSIDALIRALQQQGATVTRAGTLPQSAYPFFSVNAQIIQVNGADVQVFAYPSATRADSDSATLSPTGSPIGPSRISWMDTPNFYKRDRLVVLYVGHSLDVMKPLEAILGRPFAAGR